MAQPPTTGSLRTGRTRGRLPAALLLTMVLASGATACADGEPRPAASEGPVATVPPIEAPVQLPDTRDVVLAGVAGARPLPGAVAVRGGYADLAGVVTGFDGPVAGAQVLLERFVGEQSAELVVRTDRQGRYRALGVWGGRYRIRAWSAPDLALTVPELRFVADDDETTIDLALSEHDGLTVQAAVSDRAVLVGETVTVTALVTSQQVDGNGIVRAPAAEGVSVRLDPPSGWTLSGPPVQVVDGDGRVSWSASCDQIGGGSFEVSANDGTSATIDGSCAAPSEGPQDLPGDPQPNPVFPIGNRFSAPYAPALPAGSYEVVEGPGSCGISFERYLDGRWEPSRITATGADGFEVAGPIRDVRLIGDSPPCLYERVA